MLSGQRTFFSTYEAPDGYRAASSVYIPGDFIISGGHTSSFGAVGQDMLLVKTDIEGNFHWARKIGSDRDENIVSLIYTSTNKIAVLADDQVFNPYIHSFLLLDTSGNILVSRSFSFDGIPYHQSSNLIELINGDFLYSAVTQDGVVLVSLDNAGQTNWTRKFTTDINPAPYIYSIKAAQISGGKIALACTGSAGFSAMDEILLLIIDNAGNYHSAHQYNSTVHLEANGIFYSSNPDKIYIAGTANSSRFFAMQLDTSGTIHWSIAYLSTYMSYVGCYAAAFNPINKEISFVGGPSGGGFEIAKLDSSGNYIWSQGSNGFVEFPSSIFYEPAGSLVITGYTTTTLTTNYNQFHCKLLSDGTRCNVAYNITGYNSGYSAIHSSSSFTLNGPFTLSDSAIVFNNQFETLNRIVDCDVQVSVDKSLDIDPLEINLIVVKKQLEVIINREFQEGALLSIFDLNGKLLSKAKPYRGSFKYLVELGAFSDGQYFLVFEQGVEKISKRFILR